MEFCDLSDIIWKFLRLSKGVNEFVRAENYLLYKKFLKLYNVNCNRKKGVIPAELDVLELVKKCVTVLDSEEAMNWGDPLSQKITMFAFYTDGGTHQDSFTYFMHRLFDDGYNGSYLYSTRYITDMLKNPVHIQAYGGRDAVFTHTPIPQFKDPDNQMIIRVPVERFLRNKEQPESFKQLTGMKVDKRITHYTCICNYFMVFVSDKEIDP